MQRRSAVTGIEAFTAAGSTAQWLSREDIESWMGTPAEQCETAVHLAPQAVAPFNEAERAGIRAGNRPAVEILRWDKR